MKGGRKAGQEPQSVLPEEGAASPSPDPTAAAAAAETAPAAAAVAADWMVQSKKVAMKAYGNITSMLMDAMAAGDADFVAVLEKQLQEVGRKLGYSHD